MQLSAALDGPGGGNRVDTQGARLANSTGAGPPSAARPGTVTTAEQRQRSCCSV